MKENLKRIINLIILIAIAMVSFIFVRNIPSMIIGKQANIEQIEKIEDITSAMAPGAKFEVDGNTTKMTEVTAPADYNTGTFGDIYHRIIFFYDVIDYRSMNIRRIDSEY